MGIAGPQPGKVFAAIAAAKREVGTVGKGGTVREYGNYDYRKFDDVLNAVAPVLDKYGITLIPNIAEHAERFDGKKHFSRVRVTYDFVAEDGSSLQASTIGESFDMGDKAVVKAQTVALRIALCSVLNIAYAEMRDPEDGVQFENTAVDPAILQRLKDRLSRCSDGKTLTSLVVQGLDLVSGNRPNGEVMTVEQLQEARAAYIEAGARCKLSPESILRLGEQIDLAIENPLQTQKVISYEAPPVRVESIEAALESAANQGDVDAQVELIVGSFFAGTLSGVEVKSLADKYFILDSPEYFVWGRLLRTAINTSDTDEITMLSGCVTAAMQKIPKEISPDTALCLQKFLDRRRRRIEELSRKGSDNGTSTG